MNIYPDLIKLLKERLRHPLPGAEAQYRMAPALRPKPSDEFLKQRKPIDSSVLILFYLKENVLHSVLMQRNEYNGVHSNQISFPGGKREENDKSFEETALREAWEETGINPEKVEILGRLSSLYVPPSNFIIYPILGYSDHRPDFILQIEEVKEIIEFPIAIITEEKNRKIKQINTSIGPMDAPYYDICGYVVWGATAMVINELEEILKEIISKKLPE
jgi:8-oxo-dGTP pyrophosphatase MutT (NUDIX family)